MDQAQAEWKPDIVLDESSPSVPKNGNGAVSPAALSSTTSYSILSGNRYLQPMHSPCFVHSLLDKGASLTDWLRSNKEHSAGYNGEVGVAQSLQRAKTPNGQLNGRITPVSGSSISGITEDDEDDDFQGSLTKQLAETAVGVREMSKQLGRFSSPLMADNCFVTTPAL